MATLHCVVGRATNPTRGGARTQTDHLGQPGGPNPGIWIRNLLNVSFNDLDTQVENSIIMKS